MDVPEDAVMDSLQVHQDLATPGTSGLGRGLYMSANSESVSGITTQEENPQIVGTSAGFGGPNDQGQSNAHGNMKSSRIMPNANTNHSSVQKRLQQRE